MIGVLLPTVAVAIIPVVDEASLLQTTITAAKAILSEVHEATIASQTLQSYIQDAKALVALPLSYVDQVSALYAQYNGALTQGQGMAWTLRNATTQFEQLYSASVQGNVGLMQRAQAMLAQVRAASQAAAQATALFDRLCAQQSSVATLITASQAAPGPLGAQQASNQLLAVLADQQGSLQQIQATVGRVQVGYIMQQTVAAEQAQVNAQQFLMLPAVMPWSERPAKGFALPE